MNWKQEAVDKLKRYDAMCKCIHNIPNEIKRLELDARSIRNGRIDGMAIRSSGRREEMLINNLACRQELEWALEQAQLWVDTTEQALDCLNPEERQTLERLYIKPNRGNLNRLCEEKCQDRSTVYRTRDKALHKFALALYGAVES